MNFTNRFLFDEVMEDLQTHQDVLSIIFERDIPLLSHSETEKELRVSPELVNFLHYLENTTESLADRSKSKRIQRIHKRVKEVRMNEEAGVKYMQAWEKRYYYKAETITQINSGLVS